MSTISDWHNYDKRKRSAYHFAFGLRKLGKTKEDIMRILSKSQKMLGSNPKFKMGLLNEIEWYLEKSSSTEWVILPMYEGAFWWDEKRKGRTPDFLVAGEYPDGEGKGMFFVEVKSSRRTLEQNKREMRRMQETVSLIFHISDYDVPLFVFFKENRKWDFEKLW